MTKKITIREIEDFLPILNRKRTPPAPHREPMSKAMITLLVVGIVVAAFLHFYVEPRFIDAPLGLQEAHAAEPEEDTLRVNAVVTAYTSSADETDEDPFENASGGRPANGSLACPSKYPFGTKVEIAGEIYKCDDRMNARYRDTERFDIWMPTKAHAKGWGAREMVVEIRL